MARAKGALPRTQHLDHDYQIEEGATQSMLKDFVYCRQLMAYKLAGWEVPGAKRSIQFGDMTHTLLEHWYRSRPSLSPDEWFRRVFDPLWRKHVRSSKELITQENLEEDLTMIAALFDPYVQYWSRASRSKNKSVITWDSLEQVFDVEWKGYRLRGKIDGVFHYAAPKPTPVKYWLIEHKTKSQISDKLDDTLAFDFQNLFYLLTAPLIPNLGKARVRVPPVGVLYNIIRRPGLTNPTFDDVRKDVTKRPDHYFKRYEAVYSETRVKAFQLELQLKLRDFAWWVQQAKIGTDIVVQTYKNEQACLGRWNCEFIKACSSEVCPGPRGIMSGYTKTYERFREL